MALLVTIIIIVVIGLCILIYTYLSGAFFPCFNYIYSLSAPQWPAKDQVHPRLVSHKKLVAISATYEMSAVVDKLTSISDAFANLPSSLAEPIVKSLNELKSAICEKLDTIIALVSSTTPAVTDMDTSENFAPKKPTTPDFMPKLMEFKNIRSDAHYKMASNKCRADCYEDCLARNPVEIPRKLHEYMDDRESDEIKEHKKTISVQNVQNEINKLRLHEKINRNRVQKFDELALLVIEKITDPASKDFTAEKY